MFLYKSPQSTTLISTKKISYNTNIIHILKIIAKIQNLKMQMNKTTPFWAMPQPRQRAPSKVRVRQIPVHFVGSERNRGDSATKIQKVLRGYMVRKSVKKMVAVKVELERFESMVGDFETVEKMRKEQKERVRVSEGIMSLLLRLDSVKVLHCSALRDCRKSLIKRAIALQEMVDQIEGFNGHDQPQKVQEVGDSGNSVGASSDSAGGKMEGLGVEEGECVVGASLVEGGCLVKEEEGQGGCEEHGEGEEIGALREKEKMEEVEEKGKEGVEENCLVKEEEGQGGCEENGGGTLRDEEKMEEVEEKEGVEESCVVKEEEGEVGNDEHEEGEEMDALMNKEEDVGEESVGTSLVEEEEGEEVGCEEEEREKDCEDGNRELLKRMMEDNEKMMGMMAQLFEKNEKQTKLLSCLTQRVEMLERAFVCDKLRRKRRNTDAKCKENDPKNGCC